MYVMYNFNVNTWCQDQCFYVSSRNLILVISQVTTNSMLLCFYYTSQEFHKVARAAQFSLFYSILLVLNFVQIQYRHKNDHIFLLFCVFYKTTRAKKTHSFSIHSTLCSVNITYFLSLHIHVYHIAIFSYCCPYLPL